jgi:magnesium transporter
MPAARLRAKAISDPASMGQHPARTKLFRRHRSAPGSAPDTLTAPAVHVEPRLGFFRYGKDGRIEEGEVAAADAPGMAREPDRVLWIDVQGLGDGSIARSLGEAFDVHPLARSDIVHLGQRPKADWYEDLGTLLIVVRMLTLDAQGDLAFEQVSIVKGEHQVLTFQEHSGDCLDPLRQRIRAARANLIGGGPDYLAVQVLDAVVDGYFPVLEHLGSRIEVLEDALLQRARPALLERIHRVRRDLMAFRRAAWPLRDAVSRLLREEDAIDRNAQLYLRDVADHVHQVVDVLETYREIAGGLVELYLSMMGHRTNEVMRVLTVISSIFIPLTFVAGVYGMNFQHMPELAIPWAYPLTWLVMLGIAGTMLIYFWRKKWL